jgi:hypothetical protein
VRRRYAENQGEAVDQVVPDQRVAVRCVDLVHHEHELGGEGPQPLDEALVCGGGLPCIQNQQDHVRGPGGLEALFRHEPLHPGPVRGVASGVDEPQPLAREADVGLHGIPGHSRSRVRDGPPTADKDVEKR